MAEKRKQIPIQKIAVSNMVSIEAMVRVLAKKRIVTRADLPEEIRQVKLDQEAKRN